MASLEKHRRDWEDLARLDPMWAVVSDNDRRFGRWDTDEFFATGELEVAAILARAAELGVPAEHRDALEFGCGVGRVTRALAARFERVVGVDISTEMLTQAAELNAATTNAEFVHNTAADLAFVGDRRFDIVYSRHVLQHLPDRDVAATYLREMVRIVRPGGLVLAHLPLKISLRHRLLVVRRVYDGLRHLGVPADTLYRRLKLHPVSMLSVPETEVRAWVAEAGGRVLAVDTKQGHVLSADIYITRDAA